MSDFNKASLSPDQVPPDPDLWGAALFAAGQVVAAKLNEIVIRRVALRRCSERWVSHFPDLDISANSIVGREIARSGIAAVLLAGVRPLDLELIRDAQREIRLAPVSGRERVLCEETADRLRPHRRVILAIASALAAKLVLDGKEMAAHLRSVTTPAGEPV